jgi:ABC-type glycerol-3-phosphate transport system permease component
MDGSAPDKLVADLNAAFQAAHSGVTVKYAKQQWNGIQEKLTTALASNNPPDVVELGNTQTAKFASSGALADLSGKVSDLGGQKLAQGADRVRRLGGQAVRDILTYTPRLLPWPPTLEHFRYAVTRPYFGAYLRNSLAVTSSALLLALLIATLAALAVGRFDFRGRKAYLLLVLIVQMAPFEALLSPSS